MPVNGASRAAGRRALLRRILVERDVRSQDEIADRLARHGHRVTQTTVSRDLAALGAVKVVDDGGAERYALADEPSLLLGPDELARLLRQFAVEVAASGNLALVKTLPGSAGPVATALDRARVDGVLGTVAGDDTVMVVAREATGGAGVARRLERLWGGRPTSGAAEPGERRR